MSSQAASEASHMTDHPKQKPKADADSSHNVNGDMAGMQTPSKAEDQLLQPHHDATSDEQEDEECTVGSQSQLQRASAQTAQSAGRRSPQEGPSRRTVTRPAERLRHEDPASEQPISGPASEVNVRSDVQQSDPAFVEDVRTAFSAVPRVRPQWVDRYMKIMVVGESGMGKTTFIKNLFAAFAQDPELRVNDVPGPTSKDIFAKDPDRLLTEILVRDEATMTSYHYRVQDTPGYDNLEVNVEPVLDYIHQQSLKAVEHEQNAKRAAPLTKFEDPRVDCCVYFIAPHRLKPVDVEFMKEISKEVPVLPVLAKADSMTGPELERFRQHVRSEMYRAGKDCNEPILYEFSKQALRDAGAFHDVPPFAAIASNEYDLSVGRFWPVRKYPWGKAEALSSQHSDLAALRKLLFEVSYFELKEKTEERYYRFREELLTQNEDSGRQGPVWKPRRSSKQSPKEGLVGGVKNVVGTAGRWVLQGVLVYTAVVALQGATGRKRLKEDLEVVKEKSKEAATFTSEKVQQGASYTGEKAQVLAGVTADKAKEAKEAVQNKFSDEEPPKPEPKPRGPFGLFGKS